MNKDKIRSKILAEAEYKKAILRKKYNEKRNKILISQDQAEKAVNYFVDIINKIVDIRI